MKQLLSMPTFSGSTGMKKRIHTLTGYFITVKGYLAVYGEGRRLRVMGFFGITAHNRLYVFPVVQ